MSHMESTSDHAALADHIQAKRTLFAGQLAHHGIDVHMVETARCLVRDHPTHLTNRTVIILRRGEPEQNRNWFAGVGTRGPVMIIGMEPWLEVKIMLADAADALIAALRLRERPGEVCLTGGSGASFTAIGLAGLIAERLPGTTVKVVGFSVVARLYHRDEKGKDHYWPHMVHGYLDKPETLAGMRRHATVRPFLEKAMATPGADVRVKAFATPLSQLDWEQAEMIADLPCVTVEEVLTDDYNHDMMAWTVMPRDPALARDKMLAWMRVRNPKWPERLLQARVDREVPVALAWRAKYPNLHSLFDKF
jgi:hypothetical protein